MAVIVGNTLTDLAQADLMNDQNTTARRSAERNFLAALAQLQSQQAIAKDKNRFSREELSSKERIAAGDTQLKRGIADTEASVKRRGQDTEVRVQEVKNQATIQENALKRALDEIDRMNKAKALGIQGDLAGIRERELIARINAGDEEAFQEQNLTANKAENAALIGNSLMRQSIEEASKPSMFWDSKEADAFQAKNPTPEQMAIRQKVQQNALMAAIQALGDKANLVSQQGGTNFVPAVRRPVRPAAPRSIGVSPAIVEEIGKALGTNQAGTNSMVFGMPNTNVAGDGWIYRNGYRLRVAPPVQ